MTSPHRSLHAAAAAIAASIAVFLAAAPAGAQTPCKTAVEAHLQSQGLSAETIAQTKYITVIANLEFGTPHEYQAWTPRPSCSGSLVTKLNTSCQVRESYTRGTCGE